VHDRKISIITYNDEPIPTKGVCRITLTAKTGQSVNVMCVLVEGNRQPIFGLKACEKLGLIKRVHVINSKAVTQRVRN